MRGEKLEIWILVAFYRFPWWFTRNSTKSRLKLTPSNSSEYPTRRLYPVQTNSWMITRKRSFPLNEKLINSYDKRGKTMETGVAPRWVRGGALRIDPRHLVVKPCKVLNTSPVVWLGNFIFQFICYLDFESLLIRLLRRLLWRLLLRLY